MKANLKIVVLALLVALACSSFAPRAHQFWKSAGRSASKISDWAWSYCDYKCTYLEKYYKDTDFVVITFSYVGTFASAQPNFSACYYKTATGYNLWSTIAGSNTWYDTNCGKDSEDYYLNTIGLTPKYKVESVEATGLGVEIVYQ